MNRRRKTIARSVAHLALAAFLLRALVPVGMMAAPLADGWLFQLCPSGLAMSSYMALLGQEPADHNAHHDHKMSGSGSHAQHAESESDPACGLSAGFLALYFAQEAQLAQADVNETVFSHRPLLLLARGPPRANPTRAPPLNS